MCFFIFLPREVFLLFVLPDAEAPLRFVRRKCGLKQVAQLLVPVGAQARAQLLPPPRHHAPPQLTFQSLLQRVTTKLTPATPAESTAEAAATSAEST